MDRERVVARRIATHLLERPAEVDGSRAWRGEDVEGRLEILLALGGEGAAVRGGDADRGGAANVERVNGLGERGPGGKAELEQRVREAPRVAGRGCVRAEGDERRWGR